MAGVTLAFTSRRLTEVAGKSLFGLLVFVSTAFAYPRVSSSVLAFFPLPGNDGPTGPCAIWFVGSSSIYRWTNMADAMSPWQVNNRGVNGASVKGVTSRLGAEWGRVPPGAIVFYIGENDIAAGATAVEAAGNVAKLIGDARARMPQAHLVVIGLKPSPTRWNDRREQLRFNALVSAFVRGQRGTDYIDASEALLVAGRPGPFYQADGVHLDDRGYQRWGHAIRRAFDRTVSAAAAQRCAGT